MYTHTRTSLIKLRVSLQSDDPRETRQELTTGTRLATATYCPEFETQGHGCVCHASFVTEAGEIIVLDLQEWEDRAGWQCCGPAISEGRVVSAQQFPDPCFTLLSTTPRMSDSDGDFSDELLELAGATEKKRKRREGSSKSEAKRRKAEYVVSPCLLYPVPIAFST